MITEVEIKKMEDDIELLMQEAVLFADKSPLEPVTDLEKNLYEDVL
jgi:TPP-dependent pyruvate/acetoin dehydrogenase alpha subunit